MGYLSNNQPLAQMLASMSSHAASVGQVHILPFLDLKQVVGSLRWDLCEVFEQLTPENLHYLEQQIPGIKQRVAALDVDDVGSLMQLLEFIQQQSPYPYLVQIILKDGLKDVRISANGRVKQWTSETNRVVDFWILASDLESIASQGAEIGLSHVKTFAQT